MNKAQEAVTEMDGHVDDVRVALLRNNDYGVLDITVADLKHWAHLERTMPKVEALVEMWWNNAKRWSRDSDDVFKRGNEAQANIVAAYAHAWKLAADQLAAALAEAKGERSE